MNTKNTLARLSAAGIVMAAILLSSIPAAGQDLIPVSDVTGSSGVFVLRTSAPKKFVSRTRSTRTKSQRIESARKVNRQYTTLAKTAPRRTRTDAVDPNDARLKDIARMDKVPASKLFAGVGEYYMDRDNYNQAIDFFREALTMNADNTIAQTGLSEALALKGNELLVKDSFPVARSFFEEALKYNPKNAPAYYGLAEVLTEMDKADEAVANYEQAITNDPDLSEIYTPLGALYYQKGEIAKADEYLTKAVAASPNDAQAQYYFGLVRYSQGKDQEALTAFRKSASLDATNAEVFFYTGEALMRGGNAKDAVPEYTKATGLKPNYFEAWLGLGNAEYQLGNFQNAVDAFTKASRLKNDNYVAFNNLGDAYRQLTPPNYNQAETAYNLAAMFIQRQTEYSKEEAADMYSKAAFSIAKQCEINIKQAKACRWDAAVQALENADKLSTSGVDAANLGWAYYNAARSDIADGRAAAARPKLERAKENLQRVANSDATFVSGPMLNLGMALTDLGEFPAAIEVLNKVVKKEPKWAFALNELGLAYRGQKNYKEAANSFKSAIDKDKNFAQAYYNLAEAYYRDGNVREARKWWDNLKKMGRGDLAAKLDVATNGGLRTGG